MDRAVMRWPMFLAAAALAFAAKGAWSAEDATPRVVLVSIDGYRADYLDQHPSPTLRRLAAEGRRAQALIPAFPSATFTNHLSIITGQPPHRHGIVNNTMHDPAIPGQVFRLRDREAITNPAWWTTADPLWVSLEKRGLPTATVFWPGSEVKIQGVQPRDWLPYDGDLGHTQRVDLLLSWFDRPAHRRPRLATLYFSAVDSAGHSTGPGSDAVDRAIQDVDAALARLLDGLESRGLLAGTRLVVVSDHGMAPVPWNQQIYAPELIEGFPAVRWEWFGPASGLRLHGEDRGAVLQRLAREPKLQCHGKTQLPEAWGLEAHSRVPDIVCVASMGWSVTDRRLGFPIPGQHGYPGTHPEMHGIFLLWGRGIAPGPQPARSALSVRSTLECLLNGDSRADPDFPHRCH